MTVQLGLGDDGLLCEVRALTETSRSVLSNIVHNNFKTHWFDHHLILHLLLQISQIDSKSQGPRWRLVQYVHPH